jgi:hypothetical protein
MKHKTLNLLATETMMMMNTQLHPERSSDDWYENGDIDDKIHCR